MKNYGPVGFIKAVLETVAELLDPYPNKRKNVIHGDDAETDWSVQDLSDAYVAAKNDPGEKYWQDLLEQHLDEKERESEIVSEMIMNDYESRHESEQDSGSAETAEEENAAESDSADSAEFESGADDSGSNPDSGGYDGYIG